ncbi:MAG: M56 family metallopeptidase [Oscillospiraceae bacterium]|nr:M56 family metallopeptidase [Oscillospiraceae bacterium]
MEALFLKVLSMSATAAVVILVVLLARLPLRKAPKVFSYALWTVVLFRLLCPFSFESAFSVLPAVQSRPTADGQRVTYVYTGIAVMNNPVNDYLSEHPYPADFLDGPNPGTDTSEEFAAVDWTTAAAGVWLAGAAALLGYSLISLLIFRRRLVGSVPLEGERNVRLADHIPSPFVLGLFRPRIYLPSDLPEGERDYILLHERTHIRRFDYVFRALAWLALAIHWFNPLVWLAFHLAGKDMEMSCDEAVLRKMGRDIRADYSTSLLRLSTGKRLPAGPLAFGDGDPTSRIKNVLSYKKPALWVIVVALIGVLCAGVALATNRGSFDQPGEPADFAYRESGPAELWFDITDRAFSQEGAKIQLPEFPGVTFTLPGLVMAVTEDGEQELIRGTPIWNVYFCDLNGDGKRELCATVSYGSGIVDTRIVVYDYANQSSCQLQDRGVHDYFLRLEGDRLWAEEKENRGDTVLREGPLVMTESGLEIRQQAPSADLAADLTFSLDETDGELGPVVRMSGTVGDVALPRGAHWHPESPLSCSLGELSMVYPAFNDGIEGHVTAWWTGRRSVTLSTYMTAALSSYLPTGYWVFTVDVDSGTVIEMTPVGFTSIEGDESAEVRYYPTSISDDEAVKAARVAAKLLTAAEDYYNNGASVQADAPDFPVLAGGNVWMEVWTATPTWLECFIENDTRKELLFGEDYSLQVEDSGVWRDVEEETPMDFVAVAHALGGSKSRIASISFPVDVGSRYGELPPGHYRILKEAHLERELGREAITLSAEFEIEG